MPANGTSTVACAVNAVTPTPPTVTDNCGRTLTVSAPSVGADPACTGDNVYTYTYTTCNGVNYTCTFTYTISPPTLTMTTRRPPTSTLAPYAALPPSPTVTDNCGRTLTVSAP